MMFIERAELFQLGYVAADIDAAAKLFSDRYGMERFHFVRGEAGVRTGERRISLAYLNRMMIELIEPGEIVEDLYRYTLNKAGDGVFLHHHGYLVESDEDWAQVESVVVARKLPIMRRGEHKNRLRFIYLDTTEELGHFVEYIHLGPEGEEFFAAAPRF